MEKTKIKDDMLTPRQKKTWSLTPLQVLKKSKIKQHLNDALGEQV